LSHQCHILANVASQWERGGDNNPDRSLTVYCLAHDQ
jgi:hypothetical protein